VCNERLTRLGHFDIDFSTRRVILSTSYGTDRSSATHSHEHNSTVYIIEIIMRSLLMHYNHKELRCGSSSHVPIIKGWAIRCPLRQGRFESFTIPHPLPSTKYPPSPGTRKNEAHARTNGPAKHPDQCVQLPRPRFQPHPRNRYLDHSIAADGDIES
jgi:hypothetical protein